MKYNKRGSQKLPFLLFGSILGLNFYYHFYWVTLMK